jgi:protoporphyrinogen oxidase
MTIYILGGGPTGLAIADGVIDSNLGKFVLIERSEKLGGLAQSIVWPGVGEHDLGPHKIFSLNTSLVQRVEKLLPSSSWLTKNKISSIYIGGHFLPYPPSPFSLAGIFGLKAFLIMVMGYGQAKISSIFLKNNPTTFEDDLKGRVGAPLYDVLFKPIAKKLWGDPQKLDIKLSKGRVQTPSLFEVFGRLLKIKEKSDFEALTFRYPKGGLSKLWDSIQAKGCDVGEFRCGVNVAGIESDGTNIICLNLEKNGVSSSIKLEKDDFVVSTLPLSLTTKLLAKNIPAHIPALANEVVRLNDLILVFLNVDCQNFIQESWVFIPDPKVIFHRLSEQESFDAGMVRKGSIVCCEIMSSIDRNFSEYSDDDLVKECLSGLAMMGYNHFQVLGKKVIRLPKSYPVFFKGYEPGLRELMIALDSFENFRSVGRQGAFNYIGTLDAMDVGYGFSEWLSTQNRLTWSAERNRTNHYPVLD